MDAGLTGGKPTAPEPSERPVPAVAAPRMDVWRAVATVAAITVTLAFAPAVFFTGQTWLVVPPLAALAAALTLDGILAPAAVAGVGVLAGSACAPLVSGLPWGSPAEWLPQTALTAVAAAALAAGAALVLRKAPGTSRLLTAAAVAIVLLAGWSYVLTTVTSPAEDGTTISLLFSSPPRVDGKSMDDVVYLQYVKRLRNGEDYYRAVGETLSEANRTGLRFDAASPLSYRLPTLYALLAALPGPLAPFAAMMACGTIAGLAAFALGRRYASVAVALACAALVTAFFAGIAASLNLLMTEPWAGGLGLAAVVLLLESQARERGGLALAGAVAAGAASALFRELGIAFLLLGLLTTAIGRRDLRRGWLAFAAALVAVGAVYAVHWTAAAAMVRELGIPALTYLRSPWLHADGRGLPASLFLLTYAITAREVTGWAIAAAAWAGAVVAPRRWVERLVLAAAVLGGSVLIAVLYPTGSSAGGRLAAGYWGGLLIPLLLACAPLVLTLLPSARRAAED